MRRHVFSNKYNNNKQSVIIIPELKYAEAHLFTGI